MPTYQYACTACDHRFEAFQSFSESSLTDCPVCAGRLRKLYSGVGIVFKGSGFYRTDSRSGSDSDVAASKDGANKDGAKEKAGASAKESTPASSGGDSGSSSPATTSGSSSSSSSSSSPSAGSAKPAPTASTSAA